MKMSGEQRIAATRNEVWKALNDPDVLRRCIPGCQSLTKESDTRMLATVEIKIGPIGARFNGSVELADINAPTSYTLIIEGQGGTVGSVKSIAKVSLGDDGSGALLSYDVDAQVNGRLAQLGGPIMDATAKQLAARFFGQFGKVMGTPEPVAGAAVSGAAITGPRPTPAGAGGGTPIAWMLAVVVSTLVGYLVGRGAGAAGASDWMGIAIGLLLLIVGAVAFEYGRRAGTAVVTLDAALLAKLLGENKP